MFFSLPKLSNSFTLCGGAVCATMALLMQHTNSCALWLEERLFATSFTGLVQEAPQVLQQFGNVVHLEKLDLAEKHFADKVSEALVMPLAEGAQDIYSPSSAQEEMSLEEEEVILDEIVSLPEQRSWLSGSPVAEKQTEKVSVQTVSSGEARTTPVAVPVGTTDTPLWKESTVEFVADLPPFLKQLPSEMEHGWNMQRMTSSTPQSLPSMVDALEYALGKGGGRRAATPEQGRSAPEQKQRVAAEKHATRDTQRQGVRHRVSRRMARLTASAIPPAARPRKEPLRLAAMGNVTQLQPLQQQTATTHVGQQQVQHTAQQPPAPPTSPGETPPMRCRILLLGDSLMEGLGPVMHRVMRNRRGLEFIISAKYSTGLCRPDYFNWPQHMSSVVHRYAPDLVIFFIGANDGMPIRQKRGLVPTGGEAWRTAYAAKMDEMVNIARNVGADIIWVELPAVGGTYNKLLHQTQIAQRAYCESNGITTLRTDPFLSGEWGRFEPYGDFNGSYTRLRTKDQAHFTKQGYLKLVEHLLPIVEQRLSVFYARHPERWLSAEEVARIHRVPAVYTSQYIRPRSPKKRDAAATTQPAATEGHQ